MHILLHKIEKAVEITILISFLIMCKMCALKYV